MTAFEKGVTICPADKPANVEGFGPSRHWSAGLQLGFTKKAEKTVLSEMSFQGPLRVQRPFYPEAGVCHLYVLHPPGGLVSGDEVRISMRAGAASAALVTTPSAGKIYHSDSYDVSQVQATDIVVENADFEWLPQETIVFNGANGTLDTRVHLQGESRFIGWDIFCLGRTAGDQPFNKGRLTQKLLLFYNNKPLLSERQHIELSLIKDQANHENCLTAAWGFSGATVSGTLFATGFTGQVQPVIDALRTELNEQRKASVASAQRCLFSVTYKLGVLLVRYLGHDSEEAKQLFVRAWQIIRPTLLQRPATTPRIWLT